MARQQESESRWSMVNVARRRLLLLFPGRIGLIRGTGQGLYASESVFRAMVSRCSQLLDGRFPWLIDYFEGKQSDREMHANLLHSTILQAVIHLSISELWRSKGVVPYATIGSSLGEVTSSYLNGALELEEIFRLLSFDSGRHELLAAKSKLIMVLHDLGDFTALISDAPVNLGLCAEWGPSGCIVTCAPGDVANAVAFLETRSSSLEVFVGEYAYHTPHLAEWRQPMFKELGVVTARSPQCAVYSSFGGKRVPTGVNFDTAYWFWQGASPVLLRKAFEAALDDGYDTVLCMASSDLLKAHLLETAVKKNKDINFLDSICHEESEELTFGKTYETLKTLGFVQLNACTAVQGHHRSAVSLMPSPSEDASLDLLVPNFPNFMNYPYHNYESWRTHGSVHSLEQHDCFMVLDYDDVASVLRQPAVLCPDYPNMASDSPSSAADCSDYDRMRQALAPLFSARGLTPIRSLIEESSHILIGQAIAKQEFDVVSDFAMPIANLALGALLGLSTAQVQDLRQINRNQKTGSSCEQQLGAFFYDSASKVKTQGGDEFPARLLTSSPDWCITPEQLAKQLKLLWLDVTTVTSTIISTAVNILLDHRAVCLELQQDVDLLPYFIEEVLRFDAPEQIVRTRTLQALQIAEVNIPAGARVWLCVGAANRDRKHYPSHDLFVLTRNPKDHLAFGAGRHYFLGALFARTAAQIALKELLQTCPCLEKTYSLEGTYVSSDRFRSLAVLPVRVPGRKT